ncbi:MAG TPA: ABC transporter ATP-binding protein [Treponemataceae bacterium]|nr:ABC transporter ATP-binding protein [Treponemataceae bacterium]
MFKLSRYLKPYIPLIFVAVFFLFVQALAELSLPSLMAEIVDKGISSGNSNLIFTAGIQMLAVTVGAGIAAILVGLAASRVAAGATRDIRRALFSHIENFSIEEFDSFSASSLITRTTNDITQLQNLILMSLRMVLFAPVMGIGSIIMAIRTSVSMSWILALAVLLIIVIIMLVFSIAMPRFRVIQKLVDRLNLVSREHLDGLMVIRAFGTEDFEKERFSKANSDLTSVNLFVNRVMVLLSPLMMLIMNGVSLLIIWIGAKEIAASSMQVGQMMAYLQYAMQVIMSFLMLSMMFIMLPRAAISADRVAEVLSTEPKIVNPNNPESINSALRGVVEFRDVCFRYPGAEEKALSSISFTAKPGETVAFIGATGSGKSTLINLIPRFYDVCSGQVLVSGKDVRLLAQEELRKEIGYVPQKGTLFAGTVKSNIQYGKVEATEAAIVEAASIAQADSFILDMEGKYESSITEGGTNVSGGQRQRLAIARAIVRKPSVYIFDDSFSALDFKTDSELRKKLRMHTGMSTVLIVAQRVSTIMNADKIIVLDSGKIAGMGTHRELLQTCTLYREIASSQLSGEELA